MTYDSEADAAYLYVVDRIEAAEVARTHVADESVNLDFDSSDRLLGIEILGASNVVRAEVLREAEDVSPQG